MSNAGSSVSLEKGHSVQATGSVVNSRFVNQSDRGYEDILDACLDEEEDQKGSNSDESKSDEGSVSEGDEDFDLANLNVEKGDIQISPAVSKGTLSPKKPASPSKNSM